MPQAVHRLNHVFLTLNIHRAEHALAIVVPVPAGLPQRQFGGMRGIYQVVTSFYMLVFPEIFNNPANCCPFGVPVNQPRPSPFVDAEKVEVFAQLAVVAPGGFL